MSGIKLTDQYSILEFNDLGDERGKLVVVESMKEVPFNIERVFYIYGSDAIVVRGEHANRHSQFVLVNVAGKSKVKLDNGHETAVVELNRPHMGLHIKEMVWKEMYDFSEDSVLMVLSDTHYDKSEYIRDYKEYLKEIGVEKR